MCNIIIACTSLCFLHDTLCGIDFETRSEDDKLRAAARGHLTREGSYLVDVGKNLDEVDCKRCLAALAKLKREAAAD